MVNNVVQTWVSFWFNTVGLKQHFGWLWDSLDPEGLGYHEKNAINIIKSVFHLLCPFQLSIFHCAIKLMQEQSKTNRVIARLGFSDKKIVSILSNFLSPEKLTQKKSWAILLFKNWSLVNLVNLVTSFFMSVFLVRGLRIERISFTENSSPSGE